MMTNNIMDNRFSNEYMALYRALSDRELREGLKGQAGLDRGFIDLLRMMDDPAYIKMINDAGAVANSPGPRAAMFREIEGNLKKIQEYAIARYPEGWALIKEYEHVANVSVVRNGDMIAVEVGGETIGVAVEVGPNGQPPFLSPLISPVIF